MQHFARWTNLSETTFVLPPTEAGRRGGADYRVRIFTPGGELPFAGHPTLGTCHAWLQSGGTPKAASQIVQECQVGLITIRRMGERLAFAAPALKRSPPSPVQLAKVAGALGLKVDQILAAQMLDNGPVWLGLLLDSAQTVLQLTPDHLALKHLGQKVGVASVAPTVEVRAFAAPIGVPEDPVTGSLNASLAQWLIADGHIGRHYVAAQGACLGRAGRVHIEQDDAGQVWVGGDTVTCIQGSVAL